MSLHPGVMVRNTIDKAPILTDGKWQIHLCFEYHFIFHEHPETKHGISPVLPRDCSECGASPPKRVRVMQKILNMGRKINI